MNEWGGTVAACGVFAAGLYAFAGVCDWVHREYRRDPGRGWVRLAERVRRALAATREADGR